MSHIDIDVTIRYLPDRGFGMTITGHPTKKPQEMWFETHPDCLAALRNIISHDADLTLGSIKSIRTVGYRVKPPTDASENPTVVLG